METADVNFYRYIISGLIIFFFLSSSSKSLDIEIIYPADSDTINIADQDSSFIFGHVNPSTANLTVNGHNVEPLENGSFLAFLPVQKGLFSFACRAVHEKDTVGVKRSVYFVPPFMENGKDTLAVDSTTVFPIYNYKLNRSDVLDVFFSGTPHCRAFFNVGDKIQNIAMAESQELSSSYWGEMVFGSGDVISSKKYISTYRGHYVIQAGDTLKDEAITFYLLNDSGDSLIFRAAGKVTVLEDNASPIVETKLENSVMRTGYKKSYYYFLPKGIKLRATGQYGSSYRIKLSSDEEAWIEDYKVRLLPQPMGASKAIVRLIRTQNLERKTRIFVYTTQPVPFRVVQYLQFLQIIFYGVTADTDWIRYDLNDPLLREIRWSQPEKDVYVVDIELKNKQQWGYKTYYNENGNFVLDIKKPPKRSKWPKSIFKNIAVLIDPGHEPDTGAVGPSGSAEKDVNLLLAKELANRLKKKGVSVSFTHLGPPGIGLSERAIFASNSDADILLSLHHNALPDGVNPFKNRGTSTYYYHPQSYELARRIQLELLKKCQLNNFGLYWDNLAMCRPTEMPAVLIEPAFLMHPEEEMLINSEKFRHKCSKAIISALKDFLKENKE